jgi:hypothetical protein
MQMNEKILNGVTEYREKSLEALNRNSRDASREHMRVSQSPLRSLNRTENPSPQRTTVEPTFNISSIHHDQHEPIVPRETAGFRRATSNSPYRPSYDEKV